MFLRRGLTQTLLVESPPRSRDFYRDVLGCTVVSEERTVVHLSLGEGRLVLRQGPRPSPLPAHPRQIPDGSVIHAGVDVPLFVWTDDLESDIARLRSHGIEVRPSDRRSASVELYDPDGHPVEIRLMHPAALTWEQARHRARGFDPRDAESIAREILVAELPKLPAEEGTTRFSAQDDVVAWITRSLVARFGIWAVGWCWGRDIDGGPVATWCCGAHSITTADETAARVRDALEEWHGWIDHMAARFSALQQPDVEEAVSRAAAGLISEIVERTDCSDAWYAHATQVLAWLLQSMGVPADRAVDIAEATTQGRFNSWSTPSPSVTEEAARSLARGALRERAPAGSDALEAWSRTRAAIDWRSFPDLVVDSLEPLWQEESVRFRKSRDEHERKAFRAAVARARADGRSRWPLTWERLVGWQDIVLGAPVRFRIGPAFAKEGRERYGLGPDTEARYCQALAEAVDPAIGLPARAARLYLDTCFFHPFPDGNARAALLLLEYLLRREGAGLGDGRPIATPPRWADDVDGAKLLVGTIASLARRLR